MSDDNIEAYIFRMQKEKVSAFGLWNVAKATHNDASSRLMDYVNKILVTIHAGEKILEEREALRKRRAEADLRAAAEWERRQREGGRRPRG